jgi:hypothetical protein
MTVRVLIRKRLEQNGADHGDDGIRRADPERDDR